MLLRRFKFGLKTLLVLILATGSVLGFVSWEIRQGNRTSLAVANLRRNGSVLRYEWQVSLHEYAESGRVYALERWDPSPCCFGIMGDGFLAGVAMLKSSDCEIDGSWIDNVRDLPKLEMIELHGCKITSPEWSRTPSFPDIKYLVIQDSEIDPATSPFFDRFPGVEVADLGGTSISDMQLAEVVALPKLRVLNLSRQTLTIEKTTLILESSGLAYLYLHDSSVSDEALLRLSGHPSLQLLSLLGTDINQSTIDALSASCPNLEIQRSLPDQGPGNNGWRSLD